MPEAIALTIAASAVAVVAFSIVFPEVFFVAIARQLFAVCERWRRHLGRKYGASLADHHYKRIAKRFKQEGYSQTDLDSAYQMIRQQIIDEAGSQLIDRRWPRTFLDHWLR